MKRVLLTLFLAAAVLVPSNAYAEGRGPCSGWFSHVRPAMGQTEVEHRVRLLIGCAERRWSVVGGVATPIAIASRESSFWPWAYNPSGCAGVFQQMVRYWPGRVATYWDQDWFWRSPSAFNARANVIVSIRMMHSGGLSNW